MPIYATIQGRSQQRLANLVAEMWWLLKRRNKAPIGQSLFPEDDSVPFPALSWHDAKGDVPLRSMRGLAACIRNDALLSRFGLNFVTSLR
jgi:hypothetical protein